MSYWRAESVTAEPGYQLAGGRIYEVSSTLWPEKTRHFVGYNLTNREGRVSSAIVAFDKDNRIGKTRSGRQYQLVDNRVSMNELGDASYVWGIWCSRNDVTEIVDVTDEYEAK